MDRYESVGNNRDQPKPRKINYPFLAVILLIEICSIAIVLLMIWWVVAWHGGLKWTSTTASLVFNYHPLFMTIGFFFLYINGALFFRTCEGGNRVVVRSLHGLILLVTLAFVWLAFTGVWRYHEMMYATAVAAADASNTTVTTRFHLTSLHSWAGLSALILFSLQWFLGLFNFVLTLLQSRSLAKVQAVVNFVHKLVGPWFVVWVTAIALAGIMEYCTWTSLYDTLYGEAVIVNMLGLCMLTLGALVFFALQCREFKRGLFLQPSEAQEGTSASGDEQMLLRPEGRRGQQRGPLVADDDELEEAQPLTPKLNGAPHD